MFNVSTRQTRCLILSLLLHNIVFNLRIVISDNAVDAAIEDCGCTGSGLDRLGSSASSASSDVILSTDQAISDVATTLNERMVFIPGGSGFVGTDTPIMKNDGESPMRPVQLSPFLLDKYQVSNEGDS